MSSVGQRRIKHRDIPISAPHPKLGIFQAHLRLFLSNMRSCAAATYLAHTRASRHHSQAAKRYDNPRKRFDNGLEQRSILNVSRLTANFVAMDQSSPDR